jgi:hypothetical protein
VTTTVTTDGSVGAAEQATGTQPPPDGGRWDRVGTDPGPAPRTGAGFAACTGDGPSGSEVDRWVLGLVPAGD